LKIGYGVLMGLCTNMKAGKVAEWAAELQQVQGLGCVYYSRRSIRRTKECNSGLNGESVALGIGVLYFHGYVDSGIIVCLLGVFSVSQKLSQ
jgi:hypothetical protein